MAVLPSGVNKTVLPLLRALPFLLLDPSMLMKVDAANLYLAVATFPACKRWIRGKFGHFVGLAATAWAIICDMFTMAGFDYKKIYHAAFDDVDDARQAGWRGEYVVPDKIGELRQWLSKASIIQADWPILCRLLGRSIDLFCEHFPESQKPATRDEAIGDADAFYAAMLDELGA